MNFRSPDIWDLCPPRTRHLHGSAAMSLDSSRLSASLINLPVTHDHPLRHDHDDADFDVNAVQIGVCPQSQPTQASQMAVVRDTQKAVPRLSLLRSLLSILWTKIMPFLRGKKILPPIMGKQLRDPSMDA